MGVDEKEIENLANDYIKHGNTDVELDELIDDLSVQPYFAKQYGEIDRMEDEDERIDAEEDIDADVKATAEAVLAKIKVLQNEAVKKSERRMIRKSLNEEHRKVSQRELKQMVRDGFAEDITTWSTEKLRELKDKEGWLDTVGIGRGVYGMNCGWFRGHRSGNDYVITSRSPSLFYLA